MAKQHLTHTKDKYIFIEFIYFYDIIRMIEVSKVSCLIFQSTLNNLYTPNIAISS